MSISLRAARHKAPVLRFQPATPVRGRRVADVGDWWAASAWRWQAHRFASMSRRRGFHPLRVPSEKRGPWQTRQRRKRPYRSRWRQSTQGLTVSSALKNRPGSQVLRLRNITVFRVYRGVYQAALLRSAVSPMPMRPRNISANPAGAEARCRRPRAGAIGTTKKEQRLSGKPIGGLPTGAARQQPYGCRRNDVLSEIGKPPRTLRAAG